MRKTISFALFLVFVAGCTHFKKEALTNLGKISKDRSPSSATSSISVKPPDYILDNSRITTTKLACDISNSSEKEIEACFKEKGILPEGLNFKFEKKTFNHVILDLPVKTQEDSQDLLMSKSSGKTNRSIAGVVKVLQTAATPIAIVLGECLFLSQLGHTTGRLTSVLYTFFTCTGAGIAGAYIPTAGVLRNYKKAGKLQRKGRRIGMKGRSLKALFLNLIWTRLWN